MVRRGATSLAVPVPRSRCGDFRLEAEVYRGQIISELQYDRTVSCVGKRRLSLSPTKGKGIEGDNSNTLWDCSGTLEKMRQNTVKQFKIQTSS